MPVTLPGAVDERAARRRRRSTRPRSRAGRSWSGPLATATRLSVDATSPLLIHGDESPGLGAPTTHTVSPACGARDANGAGTRELGAAPVVAVASASSRPRAARGRWWSRGRGPARGARRRRRWSRRSSSRSPTSRSLVRISPDRRTQTPEPRRVPSLVVRAHRDDRVRDGDRRRACAVAIGVLVGTTRAVGGVLGRAGRARRPRRARRASGSRRPRPRRASWSTSARARSPAARRERRELARVQPEAVERVREARSAGSSRSSSSGDDRRVSSSCSSPPKPIAPP